MIYYYEYIESLYSSFFRGDIIALSAIALLFKCLIFSFTIFIILYIHFVLNNRRSGRLGLFINNYKMLLIYSNIFIILSETLSDILAFLVNNHLAFIIRSIIVSFIMIIIFYNNIIIEYNYLIKYDWKKIEFIVLSVLYGFLIAKLFLYLSMNIQQELYIHPISNQVTQSYSKNLHIFYSTYVLVFISILSAFSQEIFYRRYICSKLETIKSKIFIIAISSIIYALAHNIDLYESAIIMLLGMIYCSIYLINRSIIPSTIVHSILLFITIY
jgi:membrane protease YdiL (CAAX protease family)